MKGLDLVRRVAVIAYHSSPLGDPGSGDAGGMTIYVKGLAQALARKGLRTDIFTRRDRDCPRVTPLGDGVRVISIDAGPAHPLDKNELPRHLHDFIAGVRAFAISTHARYDLVHSHYWQSGLAAEHLSSSWRVPLVHSNHTLAKVKNQFLAPGEPPESDLRIAGEARVIASSDVLIASTDKELEQLASLYEASRDRLKMVYPGVDHALFKPPADRDGLRDRLGLGDAATLLYAGRIQPLKGLELAIRATEELAGALDRDVVLVVVGGPSGPSGDVEVERLGALAESLGISDRVRFLGPQPHGSLPEFYGAADAVVVTSYSESFGLAALEAHACGVPVVATAVDGLSHIVVDGASGYLVEERDPSAFAACLKTILSDEDVRARFGATAIRRAAAFDWDQSAAEFLELYECLAVADDPELCTC